MGGRDAADESNSDGWDVFALSNGKMGLPQAANGKAVGVVAGLG